MKRLMVASIFAVLFSSCKKDKLDPKVEIEPTTETQLTPFQQPSKMVIKNLPDGLTTTYSFQYNSNGLVTLIKEYASFLNNPTTKKSQIEYTYNNERVLKAKYSRYKDDSLILEYDYPRVDEYVYENDLLKNVILNNTNGAPIEASYYYDSSGNVHHLLANHNDQTDSIGFEYPSENSIVYHAYFAKGKEVQPGQSPDVNLHGYALYQNFHSVASTSDSLKIKSGNSGPIYTYNKVPMPFQKEIWKCLQWGDVNTGIDEILLEKIIPRFLITSIELGHELKKLEYTLDTNNRVTAIKVKSAINDRSSEFYSKQVDFFY